MKKLSAQGLYSAIKCNNKFLLSFEIILNVQKDGTYNADYNTVREEEMNKCAEAIALLQGQDILALKPSAERQALKERRRKKINNMLMSRLCFLIGWKLRQSPVEVQSCNYQACQKCNLNE